MFMWIEVLVFGFVPCIVLLAVALLLFSQVIRLASMLVVYCLVKSDLHLTAL